jgi:putative hydrolase of HD superfamily
MAKRMIEDRGMPDNPRIAAGWHGLTSASQCDSSPPGDREVEVTEVPSLPWLGAVLFFGNVATIDSPAVRLAQQIDFIAECDKLKEVFRQTVNMKSHRPENDAEHSWHLCLCVIVLAEHANVSNLDVLRVLKMLIVHDLVEIDAGDTFAYDTAAMAVQHQREALAADRIFGLLPPDQAQEFRALWDEFEARRTPEARFAAAVDRFQPMLLNCRTQGAAWKRHGVTHDRVVARNRHIADGCPELWWYAEKMLQEVVDAGHLAPAPGKPA